MMFSSIQMALLALCSFGIGEAMTVERLGKSSWSKRAGAADDSVPGDGEVLAGAPVNNITITPTNVIQCGQATIIWTGATNPVTLMIGVGGFYVGTTVIMTMPNLPGPSTEWTVSEPAGTDLIFQITDSNNQVGYVQNIQVTASPSGDASCLPDSTNSSDSNGSSSAWASATDDSDATASATWASVSSWTSVWSSSSVSQASPTQTSTSTITSALNSTSSVSAAGSATTPTTTANLTSVSGSVGLAAASAGSTLKGAAGALRPSALFQVSSAACAIMLGLSML